MGRLGSREVGGEVTERERVGGRGAAGQALRRESDGKALVLLDEMGTGTEPTAGSALSIALLRALVRGGPRGAAFTMATTHHGSSPSHTPRIPLDAACRSCCCT